MVYVTISLCVTYYINFKEYPVAESALNPSQGSAASGYLIIRTISAT